MAELLRVDRHRGVLRLTLDRPAVHNAFNGELIDALLAALDEAAADDGVRCVVLAGAGKSFCAGADLAWMRSLAATGAAANGEDARRMAGLFERLDRSPKPIVGRIHGAAIGGGVGLVACCDVPIALASATFAFSEVRLGLAPAVISPYVLRRIGVGHGRELFVTGSRFGAARAARIGLVNDVVEDEAALDAAVERVTHAITRGAPGALAACKALAMDVLSMDREAATAHTAALIARLRGGAEGQEGMRAFLTKREPAWVKELSE